MKSMGNVSTESYILWLFMLVTTLTFLMRQRNLPTTQAVQNCLVALVTLSRLLLRWLLAGIIFVMSAVGNFGRVPETVVRNF